MNRNVILIIGLVWPEPDSSAAGKRMLQLIALFQKRNYEITFASTATENQYNFDLNSIGVQKERIVLNCESFDNFISKLQPRFVLFDRFITEEQFGWRVSSKCPDALKILDSEDLHSLRYTRQADLKSNISFEIEHLFSQDLTKREIASIFRCDLTLVIAEFEMDILQHYFKIEPQFLCYLPLFYSEEELAVRFLPNNFEERKDFIFIGNFWHEPNWDAVLYLKRTVWPIIRKKFPSAVIKIYGAYASQKVFDLHNKKEGFLVLGRAEEARTVILAARVLLAPLRFGAGIKGKLLDAMQYGTPSVTSSIGAESINGILDWNGFISDDPIDFAIKAVELYQNEALWIKAQKQGTAVLRSRFRGSNFDYQFLDRIASLIDTLEIHRKENFIGSLLLYHSMRSTEYLSRWIEEKNKK